MVDIINACAEPDNWLNGWQALSAIGILLSWLVISLAYMVAGLLGNPQLAARAKNEVYQVIATAIMLACRVGIVTACCTLPPSDMERTARPGNLFEIAAKYLEWVRDLCVSTLSNLMDMNNGLSIALSLMGGFTIYGMGLTAQPFAGLSPLMNVINLLMMAILVSLLVTLAQLSVLKFIYAGAINLLLPVGVICRSFPFTREFGGAMMAIALSLFVLYPAMLVLDNVLLGDAIMTPPPQENYSFGQAVGDSFGAQTVISFLKGGFVTGFITAFMKYFSSNSLAQLGNVVLSAFMLPAINGVLLVAFARDLSRMFGQEVDLTGITRMI
ncbi:MAG: hypothetical protein NT157_05150 [Candidatus Micrarchaeota archaeon]|nr:hypothetical protein [Candidatus Micrarchaeota archaeon]